MKISKIKKENRIDSRNDKYLGIQTFGDRNDYPQQVMEIVDGSCTGFSCVCVYSKFINGKGFTNSDFSKLVVNKSSLTINLLLRLISNDFAMFRGFALHLNYNANYQISQISYTPFETVRLGEIDENGECNHVCLHWDWGRRMGNLRRWKKEDIIKIDLFNPDPQIIQMQVNKSGGWSKYKGQILYFNSTGLIGYPLPIFNSELTDMSTEQGISNISYRNARSNFMPSGMFIDILNKEESEEQADENEKSLLEFQGDDEACKMIYSIAETKEEIPQFVDFSGKNYDKEYTVTHSKVKGDIGRAFNQPPILRAEDVGSNFGADALGDAYDYYNSVTEVERRDVSRVFEEIFKYWNGDKFEDFSISPLSYGQKVSLFERFGKDGIEKIDSILLLDSSVEQKRNKLKVMFNLSDSELKDLGL